MASKVGISWVTALIGMVLLGACGDSDGGGGGGSTAAGGQGGATSDASPDGQSSTGCPEQPYTECQTDDDCKCTHFCSPMVPNGLYKYCTLPCIGGAECNRPNMGITCPSEAAYCCQATNACLPG